MEQDLEQTPADGVLYRPGKRTLYTYQGETKTSAAWARDPRCVVKWEALLGRLKWGWDFEQALTTPAQPSAYLYAYAGEIKTVGEWARDPRCMVRYAVLQKRLFNGWEVERALTTPSNPMKARQPRQVPACVAGVPTLYSHQGETKTAGAWSRDPRCVVDHRTLRKRLRAGWDMERALSAPYAAGGIYNSRAVFSAFGEQHPFSAWVSDPRCVVGAGTLASRVFTYGWDFEQALTTPAKPRGRLQPPQEPARERQAAPVILGAWQGPYTLAVPEEERQERGWVGRVMGLIRGLVSA